MQILHAERVVLLDERPVSVVTAPAPQRIDLRNAMRDFIPDFDVFMATRKIQLIRLVRVILNTGLKEAKDIVETWTPCVEPYMSGTTMYVPAGWRVYVQF